MEKARRGLHPLPKSRMKMVMYDPPVTHARRGACGLSAA
jgi:hypothetical protein